MQMTVTYSRFTDAVATQAAKSMRAKVEALQDELLKMPQADVKFVHEFEPGKYIRTIIAPPWSVIVGAEHKTPYKIVLKKGTVAVNIDDKIRTLTAPFEFDAPAGVKRVARVFDKELIWVDIYDNPDDCNDVETIEERIYVIPECGLLSNPKALERRKQQLNQELPTNNVKMLLNNGFGFSDKGI